MRAELIVGLARDELDARRLPALARVEAAIDALDRSRRRVVAIAPLGEPIRLAFSNKSGTDATQIEIVCDRAGRIIATVDRWTDEPEGDEAASERPEVEVGADQDGDEVASCVVKPLEEPRASRPQRQIKLSVKSEIVLDMLRKAIAAHGKPVPGHNYIPASATVVSMDLWRRFYLAGTSADGQSEDTRRAAFRRAREVLRLKKLIGLCDEMVWIP